ncbi:MAG: TRAP transporter substrate-binding protein [Burkholderiales bacterium]|nr:TRAP transporter substrate-binding protein [Burkholderiales bacterium]
MSAAAVSPRWRAHQYHYLSADSHVHPFLVDLWDDVREQTGGRFDATVHAANDGLSGSHLDIVQRLIDGDIEFYVLMGGILGPLVPAMEIQGLPFAFKNHDQVHAVFDGALGDHLRQELLAKDLYAVPFGLMENGFRHISTRDKPVSQARDLDGLRIRIPEGRMFDDAFRSLGAEPVPVYVLEMNRALAERRVDAQENPLAVTAALKLYEVTHHVALTYHMWSGFNLLASRRFWDTLPRDVQDIILRSAKKHAHRQRVHTDALNHGLEATLAQRGMRITHPDQGSFRDRLVDSGFYVRWKETLGRTAWDLLERSTGKLG